MGKLLRNCGELLVVMTHHYPSATLALVRLFFVVVSLYVVFRLALFGEVKFRYGN
jgi:hypothetical protein